MPEKLYNFSFDKKSAILLAVCSLVLAALLVSVGYLIGISGSASTAEKPADPPGAISALPPAGVTPPADTTPPAPVAAPPAAAAKPDAGPASVDPAAPTPGEPAKPDSPASPPAPADAAPDPAEGSKPAVAKPAGRYSLQFESSQDRAAALAKIKQLKAESVVATLFTAQDQSGQTLFAVRTGAYPDLVSASKAADALAAQTGEFVIVRPAGRL